MPSESKTNGRIDVHAHFLPPGYLKTAIAALKALPGYAVHARVGTGDCG